MKRSRNFKWILGTLCALAVLGVFSIFVALQLPPRWVKIYPETFDTCIIAHGIHPDRQSRPNDTVFLETITIDSIEHDVALLVHHLRSYAERSSSVPANRRLFVVSGLDPDLMERIRQAGKELGAEIIVYPHCVGPKAEMVRDVGE